MRVSVSTCLGEGTPGRTSPYKKCYVVTQGWLCACSCSSFAWFSLVASFRSCRRPCKFVQAGRLRVSMLTRSGGSFGEFMSTRLGGSFGQGCARENEPVSKMLSCDPRLALHMFMQIVFPVLPCGFVTVAWEPM